MAMMHMAAVVMENRDGRGALGGSGGREGGRRDFHFLGGVALSRRFGALVSS